MSEFQIHHHLSELCSLLGVNPVTAEKYVEILKRSSQSFLSSEASASDAVQKLASGVPDSEVFLKKYQELKMKNVKNLDALVVFLECFVGDESIRQRLESWKEDEGSINVSKGSNSNSILTSILQELQSVKEHSLTSEEIINLRRKLLAESLPASSSHNATSVNRESLSSSSVPSVPQFLLDRPFLTMNYISSERQDENVGPLGELDVSTQEHEILEDLLNLLIGINGIYISVECSSLAVDPKFTFDKSIDPSLKVHIQRILPLCTYYSQVTGFAEYFSDYIYGCVNHALAAAIRGLLKDYVLFIIQLETEHRKGALTLQRMSFYLETTMFKMEVLACLVTSLQKSRARGGAVLSLLYERTISLTGSSQLQEVLVYLTQAAAIPYMKMVAMWIYSGTVSDPYNEFMVAETCLMLDRPEMSYFAVDVTLEDDAWEKRYYLVQENIPTFLQQHADMILRTGKYINVIRDTDISFAFPSRESFVYNFHDNSYTCSIEKAYNFASKHLLKLLMNEKDLMGVLRSVKHFFLMDQGDFVVQLLTLCEPELSKNIDDVVPTRLESLLELALRTSSANTSIYKDDIHCTLLPFSLTVQMLRILSIETEEEDFTFPDKLQLLGLEGFTLTFNVKWPLTLILGRKPLACYQMIFRHLFYCKYVERLLCRVWLHNKITKSYCLSSSLSYNSAFTLRQRMLHFIQNLEYFMYFEVIEQKWHTFIAKMQKVENIDEVLVCHNDFLSGCLKDCMLTSPELLRIIVKLTSICICFANFILRMGRYCMEAEGSTWGHEDGRESPSPASMTEGLSEPDASESFEQTIARFDIQFTGMLVTLVDKISDMGRGSYNNALMNVLYRLDFNNFYSKSSEGLRMEPAEQGSLENLVEMPIGEAHI